MKCLPPNWAHIVIGDLVGFAPKNNCPDNMPVGFVPLRLMRTTYRATHSFECKQWSEVKKGYTHFADGDVLLARITPCFENGKAGIAKRLPNSVGAGSTEYFVFRPDTNFLIPELLLAFFKTPGFLKDGALEMNGAVGQQRVPKSFVLESKLPLPPLCEQKRIAGKLDAVLARVDACRERLDRVPGIIKRFRQAVLAAATSGALTEEWRVKNQQGLYNWTQLSIRDVCSESFYGPRFGKNEYTDSPDGIPTVRTTDMTSDGKINISESTPKVIVHHEKLDKFILNSGDLLITRTGSIGTMAVFEDTSIAIPSAYLIRFRFLDIVVPKYIYYFLASPIGQEHLGLHTTAITQPNINAESIKSIPFSLPDLHEQHEIVRRVEALFDYADALEAKYRLACEQVDRLTPAVLAKAFRGELVPQDPNDEPAEKLLERIRATRSAQPAATRTRRTRTPRETARSTSALSVSAMPAHAGLPTTQTSPAPPVSSFDPTSVLATPTGSRTLADLRKAAGLNQTAVAKSMGLYQAYISQMETGKRAITEDQRCKLSEILGVSVEEIPKQ